MRCCQEMLKEEARILYAARRDSRKNRDDLLLSHMAEVTAILRTLHSRGREEWNHLFEQKQRTIGLILLVALGLADEVQVDSLQGLRSVLLQESP